MNSPIASLDWHIAETLVDYPSALYFMEHKVTDFRSGVSGDCVWLLEHPSIYTAGTSADAKDLVDAKFPVYETGRGGQYTYHGPGQRIAYVMMDLQRGTPDLRRFIAQLEEWIIGALARVGVKGERRDGRVGIWVDMTAYGRSGEAKIAAIGVRVRRWVTFHGVSININPDLAHYNGIVPCGIAQHGVTSLADLGIKVSMQQFDLHLRESFKDVFGA